MHYTINKVTLKAQHKQSKGTFMEGMHSTVKYLRISRHKISNASCMWQCIFISQGHNKYMAKFYSGCPQTLNHTASAFVNKPGPIWKNIFKKQGLPRWLRGKESNCQCRRHRKLGFDPWGWDSLEEEMAPHSSILAWEVPWTEKPGGLQSMRSKSHTRLSTTTKWKHTHFWESPNDFGRMDVKWNKSDHFRYN